MKILIENAILARHLNLRSSLKWKKKLCISEENHLLKNLFLIFFFSGALNV